MTVEAVYSYRSCWNLFGTVRNLSVLYCVFFSSIYRVYPVYHSLLSFVVIVSVFCRLGMSLSREGRFKENEDVVGLDNDSIADSGINNDPHDVGFRPSHCLNRTAVSLRPPYGTRRNVASGVSSLYEEVIDEDTQPDEIGHLASLRDLANRSVALSPIDTPVTPISTPSSQSTNFVRAPGGERSASNSTHAPRTSGGNCSLELPPLPVSTTPAVSRPVSSVSVTPSTAESSMANNAILACLKGLLEKQSLAAEAARREQLEDREFQRLIRREEQERQILAEDKRRQEDREERARQADAAGQQREADEAREAERLERESIRRRQEVEDRDLRVARENMKMKLQSLDSYKDGNMANYLSRFQDIMVSGKVEKDAWVGFLAPKLPSKLASKLVPGISFEDARECLLRGVGETVTDCGYKLFALSSEAWKAKSASDIFEHLHDIVVGFTAGCKTVEDVRLALAVMGSRRLLPPDGITALHSKSPANLTDLSRFWEEWMASRHPGNFYRPRTTDASGGATSGSGYRARSHTPFTPKSNDPVPAGTSGGSVAPFPFPCHFCKEKGHRMADCPARKKTAPQERSIICHLCGTPGHKSPDCPRKKEKKAVNAVRKPSRNSNVSVPCSNDDGISKSDSVNDCDVNASKTKWNVTPGLVNGKECSIVCDTGAEVAVVPRSLVGFECEESGSIVVCGFDGACKGRTSAMVTFTINGKDFVRRAVISEEDGDGPCLFPYVANDRETAQFVADALDKVKPFCPEDPLSTDAVVAAVTTRAQAKMDASLDRNEIPEEEVLRRGDAAEESVVLSDDEAVVQQSSSEEVLVEAEHLQESGKGCANEEFVDVESDNCGNELSVNLSDCVNDCDDDVFVESDICVRLGGAGEAPPEPDCRAAASLASLGTLSDGTDLADFIAEAKSDPSLATWRELADRSERGFVWHNGRLAQDRVTGWEERGIVLAVPKSFRSKILNIVHNKGGHLGAEKCLLSIRKCFVWPGMYSDVTNYCASCLLCQKKSKFVPTCRRSGSNRTL